MGYDYIIVQSFYSSESGQRGPVHIKPLPNEEPYLDTMFVQCSKVLSNGYPVGTIFKIKQRSLSLITDVLLHLAITRGYLMF